MNDDTDHSQAAGYVLVEALISLLIVAAMTGLFFQTVSSQANTARQLELRRTATLVASSQLAAAMAGSYPGTAEQEGDDGQLHWSVTLEPYAVNARSGPLRMEQVRVAVTALSAPSKPLVVLESLRIGR